MKHGLNTQEGKTSHLANVVIGLRETCGHGGRATANAGMRLPQRAASRGQTRLPSSFRKGIFEAEGLSLRQVKLGKREKKIMMHLEFYALVFIYLVFLEDS